MQTALHQVQITSLQRLNLQNRITQLKLACEATLRVLNDPNKTLYNTDVERFILAYSDTCDILLNP